MNQDVGTRLKNLRRAPRCGARTRTGTACQRPAIRGRKRCRLHGGLSPGAPRGVKNGNFRYGNWTAEAIEERRWLRSLACSTCLRFSAAQTHTPQNALAKAHAERRCRRQVDDTASGIDGKGELRFTRLSELVEGVSQKMLTQTLRHMEHDSLITNYDVTTGHSPR